MVSDTKRVSTFGKSSPCHANILCRPVYYTGLTPVRARPAVEPIRECGLGQAEAWRGQRPRNVVWISTTSHPRLVILSYQSKRARQVNLIYPAVGREPRRAVGL